MRIQENGIVLSLNDGSHSASALPAGFARP